MLTSLEPEGIPRLDNVARRRDGDRCSRSLTALVTGRGRSVSFRRSRRRAALSGVAEGSRPRRGHEPRRHARSRRPRRRGAGAGGHAARRRGPADAQLREAAVRRSRLPAGAGAHLRPDAAGRALRGGRGAASAFFDQLLPRLRGLPGVRSASAVMGLPLSGIDFIISFEIVGPAAGAIRAAAGDGGARRDGRLLQRPSGSRSSAAAASPRTTRRARPASC